MNQEFPTADIVTFVKNGIGFIVLDKKPSLNALDLEMVRVISIELQRWKNQDNIKAVIIKSDFDRAFCSGGDLKNFYNLGMDFRRGDVSSKVPMVFFAEEYQMCKQIANYPKPIISFMNGIVMGGGYGLGGHCKYRIISEDTVFAMPEVGIGFFPDVGIIKKLASIKDSIGRYLALTGNSINAGDMIKATLADFLVPKKKFSDLIKEIESTSIKDLPTLFKKYHTSNLVKAELIPKHKNTISKSFSAENIAGILSILRDEGLDWHKETIKRLLNVSPLSVLVTLEYLNRAKSLTQNDVFAMDFTLAQHFMMDADIYEGIRAQLIHKDKSPKWNARNFGEVPPKLVKGYFRPTGYELKDIVIFED
ncbi:MAG: enoyl-CoA hydratase/isomerase family protein [Micavibrio sp.]|nr:enoyl-CoA hydratase/isomerase family protein [Micavibrio sp.]